MNYNKMFWAGYVGKEYSIWIVQIFCTINLYYPNFHKKLNFIVMLLFYFLLIQKTLRELTELSKL